MAVSRTSMNAASETVAAISHGFAAGRQIRGAASRVVVLIDYWLLVTGYWLLVTGYLLSMLPANLAANSSAAGFSKNNTTGFSKNDTAGNRVSRTPNPDSDGKHQYSAHHHLKGRGEQRRIHIAIANPGDNRQFHGNDDNSGDKCYMKIFDQEWERVPYPAGGRHQSCNRATQQRTPPTCHRSVVG